MASGSVRQTASPLEANVAADKLIDSQLSRVRRHIRITDLIAGVMIWLAGVLAFLIVVAVIDHWIIGLGIVGRTLALLALIAGSAWYLAVHVIPLLVRRINPAYAAQTIERGEPTLKNSLLNYLLLRRDNPGMHAVVYQALQQRAASDVSKIEVDQTVDRSTLIRAGYVLAGIMAVTAAYKIASPKDPFQTVRRIASPWSDIARPARVTIESLEPGDTDVVQGQSIEVSAIVRGTRGGEDINVVYSSADGQIVNQTVEMKIDSAGLRHIATLPARGNGIQQDYVYRVSAGDATTREFRLRAVPAPIMTVESVEYEYPAYTQRPREVVERQGDLKAIEGTRVTVRAKANQPIRNATIELMSSSSGDNKNGLHERLPMQFRGQDAWYSWRLELAADRQFLKPKFSAYQATFVNQGGLVSRDPVTHRIEVIPDLPPEIEILTPTKESVDVFASGEQVIEIRAIDPDFGLSNVQIRAVSGGREILNRPLLENSSGQSGQVIAPFKFRPRDYQLAVGTQVTYWAVAQDNRRSETSPQPNQTETAHKTLIVVDDPKAPPGSPKKTDSDPNAEKNSASQPMPANQPNSEKTPPEPDSNRTNPDKEPSSEKSEKDQGDQSEKGQKGSKEGKDGKNEKGESGSEQKTPSGGNSGSESSSGKDSSNSKQGSSSDQSGSGDGQSGKQGSGNKSQQPASSQPGQGGSGQEPGGKQPQQASPDNQPMPSESGSDQGGEPSPGNSSGQRTQPLHDGEVFEKALERLKKQQSPNGDNEQPNQNSDSKEGQEAGTDSSESKDAGTESARKDSSEPKDSATEKGAAQKKGPQGNAKPQDENSKAAAEKKEGSPDGKAADASQKSTAEKDAAKGQDASQEPSNQKGTGQKSTGGEKGQSKDSTGTEKTQKGAPNKQPGPDKQPSTGKQLQEQPKADQPEKTPGAGDQGKSGSGQKDDSKTGSGKKTTEGDPKKTDQNAGPQSKSGDPPPPNESEKPSETKGQDSGDRSGDGKKGAGQGANQQGKDTSGANTPSDEGAGAAKEPGTGEKSSKAGNDQRSEDPTGSAGKEKGPGSKKSSGPKGTSDSKGKQPSDGSQPQGNPDSQDKSQRPESGKSGADGKSPQGNPSGGQPGDRPPGQQPDPGEGPGADDPNLQYSRKATDMVLEYLKDQKDKPDEQLLDELGWTADDLKNFLDRWEKLKQSATEDPAARRDLDESLRGLGLRPQADKKRTGNLKSDDVRGMRESGIKSAPPPAYQEQFDAFKKGASRSAK